jgi:DNA recombination protein RmuC
MDYILLVLLILILLVLIVLFRQQGQKEKHPSLSKEDYLRENDKILMRFDLLDKNLKEDFAQMREDFIKQNRENREELRTHLNEGYKFQKEKLDEFILRLDRSSQSNLDQLEKMRETIEKKLSFLQEDNAKKLDQMREVVDEKLQSTLEKRLNESFKQVSERLELVHKGLGEMQNLASDVGDLKKVMSNVKTKGVLGEYQLENILEQLLTPAQFERNVKTKSGSNAHVEFAIKLPGKEDASKSVWLPIDAKFPSEDYHILVDAYENGDAEGIQKAKKAMNQKIKVFAKDISDKYLDPPNTTEFGIMFLPFEGLYAEILRDATLFEQIQRDYRVIITGPTTLSAILNSLQMGFKTLALEKRSGEVWEVLRGVKKEFSNFGTVLKKAQEKINKASEDIDTLVGVRSRKIELRLRKVEELPTNEDPHLLLDNDEDDMVSDNLFPEE